MSRAEAAEPTPEIAGVIESVGEGVADWAVGDRVIAVGYPSRSRPDEMRAERVTHNGFTVELR